MPDSSSLPALSGTVLWLIPSPGDKMAIQAEINRLSNLYDTVRFLPHLTLGRLPGTFSPIPKERLRSQVEAVPDMIQARVNDINCTMSPYQNLIVSLETDEKIDRLQSLVGSLCPGYNSKQEYHISLIYGKVPCNTLNSELESLIGKLPQTIHFDTLSAVSLRGGPDSWQAAWEIIL